MSWSNPTDAKMGFEDALSIKTSKEWPRGRHWTEEKAPSLLMRFLVSSDTSFEKRQLQRANINATVPQNRTADSRSGPNMISSIGDGINIFSASEGFLSADFSTITRGL